MARDRVAEIAAIRERKGKFGAKYRADLALSQVYARLAGEEHPGDSDFVPIRLVTLLEVFTRESVAELVDSGDLYVSRARELIKELKFDFDLTRALVGKTVSFGELVSHAIPLNSIADIDRAISALTGQPMSTLLAAVTRRWNIEVLRQEAKPIIDDVPALKDTLRRLFEVRHVLVHEMPEERPCSTADVSSFANAAHKFCMAFGEVLDHLIHGNYPLTQLEMNEEAHRSAASRDVELAAAVARIDPEKEDKRFQASQLEWADFREKESTFVSRMDMDPVERGTIAPLVYWSSWEALTKDRIEWLNAHFDERC